MANREKLLLMTRTAAICMDQGLQVELQVCTDDTEFSSPELSFIRVEGPERVYLDNEELDKKLRQFHYMASAASIRNQEAGEQLTLY